MSPSITIAQWILGCVLILTSLGVLIARHPVYASLSFLLTLLTLAVIYLQLSAQFIAVMQILVYAGAILVIFMFVIILFQDAHQQIARFAAQSAPLFLLFSAVLFILSLVFLGRQFMGMTPMKRELPEDFGLSQSLGLALYVDFFVPFEAVILIFLVAAVGALYIGRKGEA